MSCDHEFNVISFSEILSNSLLSGMLPICNIPDNKNIMMATAFSESLHWRSLLLVGQSQVQRSGLLFQASLTFASMEKQVMYVMTKEFSRMPPTTHGLPKQNTENMANITFKYCVEMKSLEELLIGFCKVPTELLPDVIVISGLNEYRGGKASQAEYQYSKLFSLVSETADYIGRRKQSTIPLYMSTSIAADEDKNWIDFFQQWTHETWVLEGNSNRLVCGAIQVQFNVLGANIFLKTVSKVEC